MTATSTSESMPPPYGAASAPPPIVTLAASLEARLRTVTQLRELADRALASAGGGRHERLQEMRDVYAWFEDRIEEFLAKRHVEQ